MRSILSILLLSALPVVAQIIPASTYPVDRAWVGYRGGIPLNSTIFVNLLTTTNTLYKCAGDGTTDDSGKIKQAINDCPSNQVVYAPTAVYHVNGQQLACTVNSYWTLKGDGPGKTVFKSGFGGETFNIGQLGTYPQVGSGVQNVVTSGLNRGSTEIILASTTGIAKGQLMWLHQTNDNYVVFGYGNGTGSGSAANTFDIGNSGQANISHRCIVTNISGNTIDFWPPIGWNWQTNSNPVMAIGMGASDTGCHDVVFRDFTVDSLGQSYNFFVQGVYNIGWTNVEFTGWNSKGSTESYWSCNLDWEHCYIHDPSDFITTGPSHGYAWQCENCNNYLFENNIVFYIQSGWFNEALSESIIDFNCMYWEHYGYGAGYLFGTLQGDHSPFPHHNLYTGNMASAVEEDFYYGPGGMNTYWGNYITGEGPEATTVNGPQLCFKIQSHHWSNNIVANVIGSVGTNSPLVCVLPNRTITWGRTTPLIPSYDDRTNANPTGSAIYSLGWCRSGSYGNSGAIFAPTNTTQLDFKDWAVHSNIFIHGNWDYATKTVNYDANTANHNVSTNILYASAPSWWGNLAWPPYDPQNGGLYHVNSGGTLQGFTRIPAGVRLVTGSDPPGGIVYPTVNVTNPVAGGFLATNFSIATIQGTASSSIGIVGVSYSVDTGDSGSGSGTVQWTVNPNLALGTNNVSVMIIDTLGNYTLTNIVAVYWRLTPSFSVNPPSGVSPLLVNFTDGSASTPPITAWGWQFGDGNTSTNQNPSNTYTPVNTYNVTLFVTNPFSWSSITLGQAVTVTNAGVPAPVSSFLAFPTSGILSGNPIPVFHVQFTSTATGAITNYQWEFGDGITNIGPLSGVDHNYSSVGTYSPKLIVTGPGGNSQALSNNLVVVTNPPAAGPLQILVSQPWQQAIWTNGGNIIISGLVSNSVSLQQIQVTSFRRGTTLKFTGSTNFTAAEGLSAGRNRFSVIAVDTENGQSVYIVTNLQVWYTPPVNLFRVVGPH